MLRIAMHRASYANGVLVPTKPGSTDTDPKPMASNEGTTFHIEDLFYNMPIRRKALRSANEEHGKILDIVSKYAIHNAGIALTCKKVRL